MKQTSVISFEACSHPKRLAHLYIDVSCKWSCIIQHIIRGYLEENHTKNARTIKNLVHKSDYPKTVVRKRRYML